MILKRELNRKMSWGALAVAIVFAVCVLPVAAQKRTPADPGDQGLTDGVPRTEAATATETPKAAERRDLDARIERSEKHLQELTETVKGSAGGSGGRRPINPSESEWKSIRPHIKARLNSIGICGAWRICRSRERSTASSPRRT